MRIHNLILTISIFIVNPKGYTFQCNEETNAFKHTSLKQADIVLDRPIRSLLDKPGIGHGSTINDYISLATYWWPDPDSPSGLPYIRRDGEVNPETTNGNTDKSRIFGLKNDIRTLLFAYKLTRKNIYLNRIKEMIKIWFVDPKSKMNPNLNYGQAILGRNTGRPEGIIDGIVLIDIYFYIHSIEKEIDPSILHEVDRWYSAYFDWLKNGGFGRNERKLKNNHGTWYDYQIISILILKGKIQEASRYASINLTRRIRYQFDRKGRQPLEIVRSRPLHYSHFNLAAYAKILLMFDYFGHKVPLSKNTIIKLRKSFNKLQKIDSQFNQINIFVFDINKLDFYRTFDSKYADIAKDYLLYTRFENITCILTN